jgi:hypothetical protein
MGDSGPLLNLLYQFQAPGTGGGMDAMSPNDPLQPWNGDYWGAGGTGGLGGGMEGQLPGSDHEDSGQGGGWGGNELPLPGFGDPLAGLQSPPSQPYNPMAPAQKQYTGSM